MEFSLDYYRVFYHVGKMQSISLAADELSISQPAVSQAIKNLEKGLDILLFTRTSKGVQFTAEGEVLYSYVKKGYDHILLGEKKIKEILHLESGEIRIGASDMTLQFYLLPWLELFHEKYPSIKVTVTNGPTPETLGHLQEGLIDFCVVSSPIRIKEDWDIKKVRKVEDVFVAGRNYNHLKKKKLSFADLTKLPVILLEKNTSTRNYLDSYLKEKNIVLAPEFELATSNMLVQFAVRGLGIAGVVKDFALESIEKKELFILEFQEKLPRRDFCLVTNRKNKLSIASEKLLQMIGI